MTSEQKAAYQRPPGCEITIGELLSGTYSQNDGQGPNYFLAPSGEKMYLVNVLAIVLNIELQGSITNLLFDDGTGKIILRFFEDNKILHQLKVGEIILVIGRLRMYNGEKYLSPEIVKKVSPLWLKVRAVKLSRRKPAFPPSGEENFKIAEESISDSATDDAELLLTQKIKDLIRHSDPGEGVRIEEIVEKTRLQNTEEIIRKMLERGEIFQNLPGKVKVL